MLHVVEPNRSYDPETVAVMTAAFDSVSRSVSKQINGNDDMRRALALLILKHVDRGERDPERLADLVLREWTGDGLLIRGRSVPRNRG
jgi:hypothetical protein